MEYQNSERVVSKWRAARALASHLEHALTFKKPGNDIIDVDIAL